MLVREVYAQGNQPATFVDLESVFGSLVSAVMGFAAIVLFLMIVSGGYKYLTSGGNPESAAAGRRTITYAIAGVLLIAASALILTIIKAITGADVTNFAINGPS